MPQRVIGIIPARLESTRFPGKLLKDETGKPLIVHTILNAHKAKRVNEVIVATDSPLIEAACKEYCEVVLTSSLHENGTTRCRQAFYKAVPPHERDDYCIVNIQGDQPEIRPSVIDDVVQTWLLRGNGVATAVCPADHQEYLNPNVVKVIPGKSMRAMYFSRSPIPHQSPNENCDVLRHIGIYAFGNGSLYGCCESPQSYWARTENLEQIHWLANEIPIYLCMVPSEECGIDTPEQYAAFVERYKNHPTA